MKRTPGVTTARAAARWLGAIVLSVVAYGHATLAAFQSQGGFVKVPDSELGRQETLPAAPLVMTAYAFVWAALLVYLFLLWRRLGKVERELSQVSQSLRDRAAAPGRRG